MANDTKRNRDCLQVPLHSKNERKIIKLVAANMRRNMADAARELFRREYERIQREEQANPQLNTAQPA